MSSDRDSNPSIKCHNKFSAKKYYPLLKVCSLLWWSPPSTRDMVPPFLSQHLLTNRLEVLNIQAQDTSFPAKADAIYTLYFHCGSCPFKIFDNLDFYYDVVNSQGLIDTYRVPWFQCLQMCRDLYLSLYLFQ